MFEHLKAKEEAERLKAEEPQFSTGIVLYHELQAAQEPRYARIVARLNEWYGRLTNQQQYDFCAIVCKDGVLGEVIRCFKGKVVKWA